MLDRRPLHGHVLKRGPGVGEPKRARPIPAEKRRTGWSRARPLGWFEVTAEGWRILARAMVFSRFILNTVLDMRRLSIRLFSA